MPSPKAERSTPRTWPSIPAGAASGPRPPGQGCAALWGCAYPTTPVQAPPDLLGPLRQAFGALDRAKSVILRDISPPSLAIAGSRAALVNRGPWSKARIVQPCA